MLVTPTLDRVLVKPIEEDEKVAGLDVVRLGKNAEMQMGIIEEAGPNSKIKKGTKVLYRPASGTLLRILQDGKYENYRMMLSDTITAIIT